MMKQCLVLLFLLGASFGAKSEEVIRLTSGEWTPYLSENLKQYGFISHIVTEAFALEGIKVEYIFLPWKRSYQDALLGEYDGSVIWSRNPERENDFYFSDVVFEGQSVFFHLKEYAFDWNSRDDLVGEHVGGTLGYKYALLEALEKNDKIKLYRVATDKQSFSMLLHKRIQILQLDKEAGYDLLQEHFDAEKIQLITHHTKPVINDDYHLILSKKNDKNMRFLSLFNKGLKRLKESGKYYQYINASRLGEYKNN